MPQSPLDILKAVALRNVPKPSQQEVENNDLRATAIQDQQDPLSFKSIGRNALDALTQGLTGDPFSADPSKTSLGGKLGMLGAVAPLGKPHLPIIAPEAYNDVKAGGLKLYSRLTDAFAKAPAVMKPAKAISIAQQGASKEEISLRKLGEFLKAHQPMEDIPREAIMSHLAANPIELDVVRKGNLNKFDNALGDSQTAQRNLDAFVHDLDTRYGNNWQGPLVDNPNQFPTITPEEWQRYQELENAANRARMDVDLRHSDSPEYSWLQTPGPSDNYGESLIKLPVKQRPEPELRESYYRHYGDNVPPSDPNALTEWNTKVAKDNGELFTSGHFQDDPNTLVWSRHNDRFLHGTPVAEQGPGWSPTDVTSGAAGKGRFIEEIQSDWHQKGREKGYKGDPLPEHTVVDKSYGEPNFQVTTPDHPSTIFYGPTPEAATEQFRRGIESGRVPDAPFKDTYHELALKQQLLDAANDPSLEWLGVADAETNRMLEGHPELKEGTRKWYDEKHPSVLEKLLKPLGGNVEYDTINNTSPINASKDISWSAAGPHGGMTLYYNTPTTPHVPLASVVPPYDNTMDSAGRIGVREAIQSRIAGGGQIPGQGMWKASLTPELKELIKTRGFPAMALLAALQQSVNQNAPDKQ